MKKQKLLKRFCKNENGASAVEFALVVPIFLAIIFGIFEVGFIFLTDLILEQALSKASRDIRTGTAHKGAVTEDTFKSAIVSNGFGLVSLAKLHVEAEVFNDFGAGSNLDSLIDPATNKLINKKVFNLGGPKSIITVRSTYVYDILNPFGAVMRLSNYGTNKFLFVHIVAFKNEPF